MTPYEEFGIQCRDGWKCLYEPLIQQCTAAHVPIYQIKAKFGTLRFYVRHPISDELRQAIHEAETLSTQVCEVCGATGELRRRGEHWYTSCERHIKT